MKVIDIICRTRDAVMQLELSDKTKTNYIYCGFGAILNFFISRGEESYSPETLALFEKTVQENFVNGAMQKASFQTMRKAAHWIEEYLSTGQVSQQKLRNIILPALRQSLKICSRNTNCTWTMKTI